MHDTDTGTAQQWALTEHMQKVEALHDAAWSHPIVHTYKPGDVVWMWDHYNTATVTGPGDHADAWMVTTTDADGSVSEYEYPSGQLRPAVAPLVFTWSVPTHN